MSDVSPPAPPEHNQTGVDLLRPMPRPKVRGPIVDAHAHLFHRRHADQWFRVADRFGVDVTFTMTPYEEAAGLARDWGHRLHFIAVPDWLRLGEPGTLDSWLRKIDLFRGLGSRIGKLHVAPATIARTGLPLDCPTMRAVMDALVDRGMAIMTHVGDPQLWYDGRYAEDAAKYGTRAAQYDLWEKMLEAYRGHPWLGAHLGGNPEDLPRLQRLLDAYPDLVLDLSATRWIVREVSKQRDAARAFVIRNKGRLLWGSDQVSNDARCDEFLASRYWCHRKLWETGYVGTTPIFDSDLPADEQPELRGLALPDDVLQAIYHDNAVALLARVGAALPHGRVAGRLRSAA